MQFDGFQGWTVAIDRDVEFLPEGAQPMDMVGVLVGDQDARQALRLSAYRRQALTNLTQAEPASMRMRASSVST